MRVIIAGGRDFKDYKKLKIRLNMLRKLGWDITTIISGGARGADKLGERYANENNIPIEKYPAKWAEFGRSAGYRRNVEMAENADALLAFWDGKSKGTRHMIDIAVERELPYIHVARYDGQDS